MKKAVLFLIMFFAISVSPSYSHTLKGEVTYTVERARKEAFTNVEYSLPQSIIDKNIKDPNFKENIKAIKLGATELKDRYITSSSDGHYGVIYKKNLYYEYDYYPDGKLEGVGKRNSLVYPVVTYFYSVQNELKEIMFHISPNRAFQYSSKGDFLYYWIDDKCFDAKDNYIKRVY